MTTTLPTTQSPLDNITYEDLYRRWENGNWKATEIDFTTDAEQWRTQFTDFERKALELLALLLGRGRRRRRALPLRRRRAA